MRLSPSPNVFVGHVNASDEASSFRGRADFRRPAGAPTASNRSALRELAAQHVDLDGSHGSSGQHGSEANRQVVFDNDGGISWNRHTSIE